VTEFGWKVRLLKRSRGHKETLKLALDEANKKYPEHVARVKA